MPIGYAGEGRQADGSEGDYDCGNGADLGSSLGGSTYLWDSEDCDRRHCGNADAGSTLYGGTYLWDLGNSNGGDTGWDSAPFDGSYLRNSEGSSWKRFGYADSGALLSEGTDLRQPEGSNWGHSDADSDHTLYLWNSEGLFFCYTHSPRALRLEPEHRRRDHAAPRGVQRTDLCTEWSLAVCLRCFSDGAAETSSRRTPCYEGRGFCTTFRLVVQLNV